MIGISFNVHFVAAMMFMLDCPSVLCLADCHRLEMFVCRSGSSLVIGVEPGVLFSPGINLV